MKNFATYAPRHSGLRLRRSLSALVAMVWLSVLPVCAEELPVFDQILQNICQQELAAANTSSEYVKTRNYLATLRPDGSFPDIAYASTSLTNWEPQVHLDRMKSMVLSYVDTRSDYCGDATLYDAIVRMLNYWYEANPTSTNWYYWEIGWPQRMGLNLSLMRAGKEKVPAELEAKILERMQSLSKGPNQAGSRGSGANKMDIALQWIYRTTLQRDKASLDFAVDQFLQPLSFNTGEGLQSDYSYLQHGQQLYIGGYGQSTLTAYFKVAFYLLDTEYAGGESQAYINHFVLQTYMPAIRGQYMLYGAIGRGMARKGGIARVGFASSLQKMIQLDPDHQREYEDGILRLSGTEDAGYGLQPYHRHYWRGDYTLHQRPGYTMDVRLASTRTCRCENGNGENLKGYFLTEGGTEIVQRGDEYLDIFPVWDWSHIPGTTSPALADVPRPSQWGQSGQSTFAGGVSDGAYGLTAYRQVDNDFNIRLSGYKAWFFFDREVVCLGSGIRSVNASQTIHTTVNQCLLKGDVTMALEGEEAPSMLEKGTHEYDRIAWLNQDGISYHFPEGGRIGIRNEAQSGTWNSIATTNQDDATVTKDVFTVWLDHGIRPTKAGYAYYIVPNTPTIADGRDALDDLLTLNTDTLQAVYNRTLHIVSAVFYRKGTLKMGDVEVGADAPCAVMFRDVHTEHVKTYVADPSYTRDTLTLHAKFPMLSCKTLGCKFDRTAHYAGSTHAYEINARTDDYANALLPAVADEAVSMAYDRGRLTVCVRQEVGFELYDVQGMQVRACRLAPGEHRLDVGSLPDGIYVAKAGGRTFRFGK